MTATKRSIKSRKVKSKCPRWFSTFSNKLLPAIFFFALAIVTLHYIPTATTDFLKINLSAVFVTASTLAAYLAVLAI